MSRLSCRQRCLCILLPGLCCLIAIVHTYKKFGVSRISAAEPVYHAFSGKSFNKKAHEGDTDARVMFSNRQGNGTDIKNVDILIKDAFQRLQQYNDDPLYNIDVSKSIALGIDQKVPDTRPETCQTIAFPQTLPKASIVIPYHKEHWSVILRSLHHLYKNTNLELVSDIVMVDDQNQPDVLAKHLLNYMRLLPKLTLLRTNSRQGLIRSRMIGARAAKGEVLVILDAHMIFNKNWLEPLLAVVQQDKSTIAIPALDNVDPKKQEYHKWSGVDYGQFDWELDFKWVRAPEDLKKDFESGKPIPTPTMLGCAMAVNKEYFFLMGGLDEGLSIWGGESLEISFRTWMCGGKLMIVPCSKIGHLFRTNLPYMFSQDLVYRNLQRVAEVWMDEYKQWFYVTVGKSFKYTVDEMRSLHKRMMLRDKLQCKSFDWYLENVSKVIIPPQKSSILSGQMVTLARQKCISTSAVNKSIIIENCNINTERKVFHYTRERLLKHHSGQCMGMSSKDKNSHTATLFPCNSSQEDLRWSFIPVLPEPLKPLLRGNQILKMVGQFRWEYESLKVCLELAMIKGNFALTVMNCEFNNANQYWIFSHKLHKNVDIHNIQ